MAIAPSAETSRLRDGIPLEILDPKTQALYLPLAKDHHAPANDELMFFIEEEVVVTGSIVEKDSMKAMLLEKVEASE